MTFTFLITFVLYHMFNTLLKVLLYFTNVLFHAINLEVEIFIHLTMCVDCSRVRYTRHL